VTKGNGEPCKKCGTSEWDKKGNCVACARERARRHYEANREAAAAAGRRRRKENPEAQREKGRRWREAHPEAVRENARRWYEANLETALAKNRRWRERNPEATRESRRRWKQANLDAVHATDHRRRTRKTGAGGSYTASEWQSLIDHYGGKCLRCGRDDVPLTADHVVPVAAGGTSNIDNIQPLCGPCNSSKRDKTIDYRPKSGLGRWIQRKLFG